MAPPAERLPSPRFRHLLEGAYEAAIHAVQPAVVLRGALPDPPCAGRVILLALGKAADAMALEAERHYRNVGVPVQGVVVTPEGNAARHPGAYLPRLTGTHPTPSEASRTAGEALLKAAGRAEPGDLVLVLVSGGGSALAVAPDGVTLDALTELHEALLRSGAAIDEMNLVRRQLDRLKGGGLAAAAAPARVVTLALSDVVGDDPLAIASGPTVPDPHTPADALAILDRHGLDLPEIRARLQARAAAPDTAPPSTSENDVHVIATNRHALEAAQRYFEAAGVEAHLLADDVTGDAREAGRAAARGVQPWLDARRDDPQAPSIAFLTGGETTVTVRGSGRGGRNSTYALAFALALPGAAPVHALIADSDGIDGSGGHAGAFVEPDLFDRVDRATALARDADDDSYAVFEAAGALYRPGPTGTNVNDLRFVLLPGPSLAGDP